MLTSLRALFSLCALLAGMVCCSDCDCGCQGSDQPEQTFACSDCNK